MELVPARSTEIMETFDLMSYFEGGIDMHSINPKIISKIIWLNANGLFH